MWSYTVTCKKCGETLTKSEVGLLDDSSLYDFNQGFKETELHGWALCKKCMRDYQIEKVRANKLAEAELNARFWRGEVENAKNE